MRGIKAFCLLIVFGGLSVASAKTVSYRVVSQTCASAIPVACKDREYETVSFEVQSPSVVVYQKNGRNIDAGNLVLSQASEPTQVLYTALSFDPDLKYLNFSGSHEVFTTNTKYVIQRHAVTINYAMVSETEAILQETVNLVDTTQDPKGAEVSVLYSLRLRKTDQ